MNESTAPAERRSLVEFANYLAGQQTVITEQWLLIVRRDTQIETADRLPTPELVDHLPRLLRELCDFLRTRDVDDLTGDARRDASLHGELRWRVGYKIDELVRELEAFRRLVASSVFRYRDLHASFKGSLEASASALIQQFFAEITVASVRQFMQEQQNVTHSRLQQLADTQQQLGRATAELNQARDAQHHAATIVAHELRHFLESEPPTGTTDERSRLALFIHRLLEYAELNRAQERPADESFDPRALFSDIVATHKPLADAKGLQLLTDCLTAPAKVRADRARVKTIAQLLLENAIEYTQSGRVSFVFSFPDTERWAIKVNDTGPGLSEADSEQLFSGDLVTTDPSPGRGMSLTMVKDLARSLGGSLQTTTQAGLGTRMEVSFPRLTD